ncbi:isocitrate lyase/PEP mutase family protein [Marinitenerispora sediminis]|uniref:Carboxyvinyl-carboxyphosphonate phosphorylmutase n=1 Tax=Marinitenerispora sediminis TaxID=1931232 RepID=A0A368T3B2_9ACTN|nr:isocitrate lyase/phosphoenolpyruvate mutase family protein [Marinitenerispora sediminis]RCV52184.1 carboxyvinyl-carboxyphosphonate phosphorylmutase [Marinitenerispora sediminis]RCV53099.1 carboxyvinyl-carboxyphosphonate phosphorylmutase [Marinitenerispora sediminis]RCV56226.1 carboxyvinyl-carboxyphosphonate phosphorylmutase [Marinitenerispora sediminis]
MSASPTGAAVADRAAALRALHVPGDPVVLPNAWDAASARTVVSAGFPAVATASAAVAPALGYGDHEETPAEEMFAAVARIARAVPVPVTADIERGYGLPPAEIADRLAASGAVGCNLEDTDPATGKLAPVADQAEFLAAFRAAAPDAVLNARVDVFLHGTGTYEERLAEAIERGRRYVEAGADCVYPIAFDLPAETVRALVEGIGAPVNATAVPGSPVSLADLAAAGVARVSFGPGLFMAVEEHLAGLVAGVREGKLPPAPSR